MSGAVIIEGGDLADVLTDGNAHVRAQGRAIASGWLEGCANWMNAELDRGTSANDVLRALMQLQVQAAASLSAQTLSPRGDLAAKNNYVLMVEATFCELAQKTRSFGGRA